MRACGGGVLLRKVESLNGTIPKSMRKWKNLPGYLVQQSWRPKIRQFHFSDLARFILCFFL